MTTTETRPELPLAAGHDEYQQAVAREQQARDLAVIDRHITEREGFAATHRRIGLHEADLRERHALQALVQVRNEMAEELS